MSQENAAFHVHLFRLIYNTIFSVWKVLGGLFLWNALAFTTASEEAGNEEKVWNN